MPDPDRLIILPSARRHFDEHGWTDDDIHQASARSVKQFVEGEGRYMLIAFDRLGRPVELGVERAYDVDGLVAFHFNTASNYYLNQL